MKFSWLYVFFLLLTACGGGSNSNGTATSSGATDLAQSNEDVDDNKPIDAPDKVIIPKASNSVIAVIQVGDASLENIIIDYSESPVSLELKHEVFFDITNDGAFGKGDLVFWVTQYKEAGDIERSIEFSTLEASLLSVEKVTVDNTTLNQIAIIDLDVIDNYIIFSADKSLSAELKKINSQTQVSVHSFFFRSSIGSYDHIPQAGEYTQVQDNSLIEDVIGDHSGPGRGYADIKKFELFITD